MKSIPLFISVVIASIYPFVAPAQTATVKGQKAVMIWVYTKQGGLQKGVWYGNTDTSISICQGKRSDYLNQKSHDVASINYENISIIKIKKPGGLLKGLLIGAGVGLAPIAFGQGGAFVAIVSLPVGIIVGSIVGATSKKKYVINGDLNSFKKFTDKYARKL